MDSFQYKYNQFYEFDMKFILDLNMSTRFAEVCYVILCLGMGGKEVSIFMIVVIISIVACALPSSPPFHYIMAEIVPAVQ